MCQTPFANIWPAAYNYLLCHLPFASAIYRRVISFLTKCAAPIDVLFTYSTLHTVPKPSWSKTQVRPPKNMAQAQIVSRQF